MKNFISMRRKQLKVLSESQKTAEQMTQAIHGNDHESFKKFLNSESPTLIYNYLFSQDQLLKSPPLLAMEQTNWYQFLTSINAWSNKKIQLIQASFEPALKSQENNQANGLYYFLKSTFQSIVRAMCGKNEDQYGRLVQLMSDGNTLFGVMMRYFLTYQNLKLLIPENKQLKMFEQVFTPISANLNLKSAADISKFGMFKLRQKTWKQKNFSQYLPNPDILILNEMSYNFMHELAIKKDEKLIKEILQKLQQSESQGEQSEQMERLKQIYFCSFNSGNQTAIDIILGKWSFQQIQRFLKNAVQIQSVHFSINCLNKIICNRLLNQSQVKTLIEEALSGQIGQRGYCQRIIKEKLVKKKNFEKVIKRESSEYVIVLDRRRVLMAKDKKQSYPLLNYLDRFKQHSSLKIISKLFFQLLDRQVIKTKVISVLNSLGIECKQFQAQNQGLKQIEEVIYYHQSLLNFVSKFSQGELLEFFVDKMFVNYFTISIWSKNNGNPVVHMVNRHFVTDYIQNNENLSQTNINKKILSKIFDAKDNQKFVNNFNIYVQLLRQLKKSPKLQTSTQWLPTQIRQNLREYFLKLDQTKFQQLYTNINEGQKEHKMELIQLVDLIFNKEEVQKYFGFAVKAVQEEEKVVDIQERNKELTKVYLRNRCFENFQKVVRNQVEIRAQSRIQVENHKKQKQEQKEEIADGQNQPVETTLYWKLELDECDLQKKLKLLIDTGYQIDFRTSKRSILGENELKNHALANLSEPYKTLASTMFTYISEPSAKKNELWLHQACLIVEDEHVATIVKFLQSAPQQFLLLKPNYHLLNTQKLPINPSLLLSILQSPKLSTSYNLRQQKTLNAIAENMNIGIKMIIANLEKKPEKPDKSEKPGNGLFVEKMLAYRQFAVSIGEEFYKENLWMFEKYMGLHSQRINLVEYYKHISLEQLLEKHSVSIYMKALKASENPSKLVTQTLQTLQPTLTRYRQIHPLVNEPQPQITTQQKKQHREQLLQQYKILQQKLKFNVMIKKYYNSGSYITERKEFVEVLNTRFQQTQLREVLGICPPDLLEFYGELFGGLEGDWKAFLVLDLLISKSMEENAPSQIKQFYIKIRKFILPKSQPLNSAISAFVTKTIRKFMSYQTLTPRRKILDYKQFLQSLSPENYKIFLKYLRKMLALPQLEDNLKEEVLCYLFTVFYHDQDWGKVMGVGEVVGEGVVGEGLREGVLEYVFDLLVKNRSRQAHYQNKDEFRKILTLLQKQLKSQKCPHSQSLFLNIWTLDPTLTPSLNPPQLDLLTIAKCLRLHPQNLPLLKPIKISQNFPTSYKPKQQGQYLPLNQYNVRDFQKCPYLVDLMVYEEGLRKVWVEKVGDWVGVKKYGDVFDQKKKCVFLVKEVMARYQQVYSEQQIKKYCKQIFTLQSFQTIPKAYLQTYFSLTKKIPNLPNLPQPILTQLLSQNHLCPQNLLQIIKSCRMPIIEAFLKKFNISLTIQTIQKMEKEQLKNGSFVLALLYLGNQGFVVEFLGKFGVFGMYPESRLQDMVKDVLWGVAVLHRTEVLKVFLRFVQNRVKGQKLVFHQAEFSEAYQQSLMQPNSQQNQDNPIVNKKPTPEKHENYIPKQSQNSGLISTNIYLPIRAAAANNFYEYYFLLLQSNSKITTHFHLSARFLFGVKPQLYAFIPVMKERLELFKIVGEYFGDVGVVGVEGIGGKFRGKVRGVDLGFMGIVLGEYVEPSKNLDYFFKFIVNPEPELKSITTHRVQQPSQTEQEVQIPWYTIVNAKNPYITILFLKTLPDAPIPEESLIKLYPEQTKLVQYLLKNWKITIKTHAMIHQLLQQHELLRDLLYCSNPKYFLQSCQHQPLQTSAILFSHAFTTQLRYFQQPQHSQFLQKFIHECYFAPQREPFRHQLDQQRPFDYRYNDQKLKEMFMVCLVSRYEGTGAAIREICKGIGKGEDQVLVLFAIRMCTFKTYKSDNPDDQDNIRHNFGLWTWIADAFLKMQKIKKFQNKSPFKPFICQKYQGLINFQQNKPHLAKASQGLLTIYAALTYLCNLTYLISQQKQLSQQIQKLPNPNPPKTLKLTLTNNPTPQLLPSNPQTSTLTCQTPYQILSNPNPNPNPNSTLQPLQINPTQILKLIQKTFFLEQLKLSSQIIPPCQCLAKLTFVFDVEDFKKMPLSILKMVGGAGVERDTLGYQVKEYLKELSNVVDQQKDGRVYSLSDVYGPVVINDETDKNKVLQCLSFYQFCKLPDATISVHYSQTPPTPTSKSLLSDLNEYLRYFTNQINDDQSQNKSPYKFSTSLLLTPQKTNPDTFTIHYHEFHIHNIIRFIDRVNKYGREMTATFNYQILCKYSIVSVLRIVEGLVGRVGKMGDGEREGMVMGYVSEMLSCKRHIAFVEELLLMVSEDAQNIMKAVKGILIVFQYSPNPTTAASQQPYKCTESLTYFGLDFKISDQIFKILIKTGPSPQKCPELPIQECNLISRKHFLNTVFTSTQFLTGYFINKAALANQLVKNSKEISRTVNSVVSLAIGYKELELYVDRVKEGFTIKEMDGFLTTLNNYILVNYVKFVNTYINSRQLAIKHQVTLLKYFQKLSQSLQPSPSSPSSPPSSPNHLQISTKSSQNSSLTQIYNFSSELKTSNNNEVNIKNMYLIQIYKNYFASVVSQGMMFILGFKTNKPTLVVKLEKKEDVDKVNISELSFLLVVSGRIPTDDQISYSKIIKIFVTDLTQNIYQLSKPLTQKLLSLPQQSQQRTLANTIPIIEPNIILTFTSQFSNPPQKPQPQLKDDPSHRYLELTLNKQNKFKIKLKNEPVIACIDLLKIDVLFRKGLDNLGKIVAGFVDKEMTIRVQVGDKFQAAKAAEIFGLAFFDVDQMISNLFFEPPRNWELETYVSVEKGEDIRENLVLKLRRKLFQSLYQQIQFQILEQGDSTLQIQNKTIKISLAPQISHTLNSSTMSDILLKDQIEKLLKSNQKLQKLYKFQNKVEDFAAILDHLLIGKYQMETVERVLGVFGEVGKMGGIKVKGGVKEYRVVMKGEEKSGISYDKQCLTLTIRLKSPKRHYFPCPQLLQFLLNNFKQTIQPLSYTKFTQAHTLEFYNYRLDQPLTLILENDSKIQIRQIKLVPYENNVKKCVVEFGDIGGLGGGYRKFYTVERDGDGYGVGMNYFWGVGEAGKGICDKKNSVKTKQKQTLLLVSPTPINMSECSINVQVHLLKNQKPTQQTPITKKSPEFTSSLHQLSKQLLKLELTPNFSSNINISLGKFKLLNNQSLETVTLVSTSGKAMVEENTKFVELIFRNKVIKPQVGEIQRKEQNVMFNQPAEKVSIGDLDAKKKDRTVQQMVYIVNEHARKFLTRAGESRIDVINLCDEEGNAINFKPNTKIFFRHLNISEEVIIPEIKYDQNSPRVELKWVPNVRGPYEVFLNTTRLNPSYQIGACAAVIDIKSCKIQPPKKIDLCFMQQTQCSLILKDSFGNIYTELQQAIINDELIIELESQQIPKNMIKSKAEKIDKYGLKKIRFSIDDPDGMEQRDIGVRLLINMEVVAEFGLKIKGQSLGQRRKNLEKDIQSATKKFYLDISVSRSNFMESLFKIAEKSLDKTFSVKFAGQQGIDAGGLKRQFYDMIGKQMKDPQNPFFIQTDSTRHNEYFINPEILKNKKKLDYMTLFGKYLANSFLNGYLIGINFSTTFIKLLYDDPITFQDMLTVLPKEEASRYQYLSTADADYIDDLQIYFSCMLNRKKGIEVEMKEDGKNIKVTKDNVAEYLSLLPEVLIVKRYQELVDCFRDGFNSVFEIKIVRKWIRTDQFWCMTAGVRQITPQIVLNYIVIRGGKQTHHSWFRTYITEAPQQILQGFLKFSSGSSSIDFYQSSKITVQFENQGQNPKKLPISHTCWKQIQIPAYKSFAIMKQLLNAAFLYCSEGFGFG